MLGGYKGGTCREQYPPGGLNILASLLQGGIRWDRVY
jgi:hypothetical protein